ncbi:MAG: APC family permease [Microbacterium sp.]|uniref:APC family permease n=1 Tax=Microbacterium sp. TaxID=51671 RepID=UPI001D61054F|nr:APC family permease [Microbacterium sp.]MBW8763269.1 APC family permease [Microbacterium sp.]
MTASATETRTENGLRPNSLGVAGIVFFVVAAASPLSAVLGSSPAAIGAGNGAGAPSAYLIAGALLLIFSVGYSAMSRKVTSGGGFAAYVQAALGERAGRAAGYLASIAYLAMQAGLYGIFGFFANFIFAGFGLDLPWYVWALVAWALASVLAHFDIDLSAKVLGLVMILEVLVLLVVSVAIVFSGGAQGIDAVSFTPAVATGGEFGLAMMFAFASFIGFEATAIYSEEARDRDRTIPRATYTAVIIITLFLVFTVWSFVIGYGSDQVQDAARDDPDNFVFGLAASYVGPTWAMIMMVLLITSFFAALLAFQNTIARYLRVLAVQGWAPRALSRTHPKHRSPHIGSAVTSAIALLAIVVFAVLGLDPYTTLFMWFVGVGTLAIVVLQTLTSASVVVYFRRNGSDHSIWRTLTAPVIGTIGLAIAAVLVLINWPAMVGADSGFSQLLPWIIPIALLIGIVLPLSARRDRAGNPTIDSRVL